MATKLLLVVMEKNDDDDMLILVVLFFFDDNGVDVGNGTKFEKFIIENRYSWRVCSCWCAFVHRKNII